MTEPGSSGPSKSDRPKPPARAPRSPSEGATDPASRRRVAATLAGGVAGAAALALLLLAGLVLYQRLWGSSTGALALVAALFGAAGLYAGWIAATMVFAALRGGGDG